MSVAGSFSKSLLDSSVRPAAAITLATRLFKYLFLIVLLVVTLKIVYDGYSYYLMRRSIDTELQSKKITSIEQLSSLQEQNRALIVDTLESRCAERDEIAFFRVFDVQKQNRLSDYFRESLAIKGSLVDEIKRLGPGIMADVPSAVAFVNRPEFTVAIFKRDFFKFLPNASPDDQKYKDLKEQIEHDLTAYDSLVLGDAGLRELVKESEEETRNAWHLESVRALEKRLDRLKDERATLKSKLADMDDIVARYNSWTEALSGGRANDNVLDRLAVNIDKDDATLLADVKCDRFNDFYKAVRGNDARNAGQGAALYRWYGESFVTFFFAFLGERRCKRLRLAVMDMWKPFLKSTNKKAPQAAILFDKFHILRHLGDALDKVRKQEYATLDGEKRKFIKGQKYALLSHKENLEGNARKNLKILLAANKRLNTAYVLKESFGQLWDYNRQAWARKFFENWRDQLKWQRLKPYEKFAAMIDAHWDGIAAYCEPENKVPLGFVEGLNNKIRVFQRRAYGLRDEEYLRLKVLSCMLPEI